MKKLLYILCIIAIVIIAIIIGRNLYKSEDNKVDVPKSANNNMISNETVYSTKNDITIQTTTEEEKVSPNATFIFEKKYEECGHTIKEYKQVPQTSVNLNKEEIEEKYKEWSLEKFTASEVILLKEESGMCNEHYILKEKDGLIAIYRIEQDEEILEELTGISVDYLTLNDQERIKQGIKVYGKEQLNSTLEDYE